MSPTLLVAFPDLCATWSAKFSLFTHSTHTPRSFSAVVSSEVSFLVLPSSAFTVIWYVASGVLSRASSQHTFVIGLTTSGVGPCHLACSGCLEWYHFSRTVLYHLQTLSPLISQLLASHWWNHKQGRAYRTTLRDAARYVRVLGMNVIEDHFLSPVAQNVLYPSPHSSPLSMCSNFFDESSVWDRIKGLLVAHVDNINTAQCIHFVPPPQKKKQRRNSIKLC